MLYSQSARLMRHALFMQVAYWQVAAHFGYSAGKHDRHTLKVSVPASMTNIHLKCRHDVLLLHIDMCMLQALHDLSVCVYFLFIKSVINHVLIKSVINLNMYLTCDLDYIRK